MSIRKFCRHLNPLQTFLASLILLTGSACGGGFEGDVEKAEDLLSSGEVTLTDAAATDEPVDESTQFKTFAAEGEELLSQYFDQTAGTLLEAYASEEVTLRRRAMLLYAECIIGSNDVNFFGLFSSFLGQTNTGDEFAVFAGLLPDDFDSDGYAELQFAETVVSSNTVAVSYFKAQETESITVDAEINYILTFINLLSVSFIAKQFGETGELTPELAQAFVDNLDGTIQTLTDAGIIDAEIAATLQANSDTIAQGLADGGDVQTVVDDLLSGNFD